MAGNALAKLYSWADGVKRRVSNPLETIALGITRAGEDLGAAATDADIAYGRNGMKSVLLSEQQKAEAAERAAKFGEQMAMAAATVWHGSPHKFDKFDSSKIGTGEGAQAYGHGLYLAESPGVAKSYQEALAPGVQRTVDGMPYDMANPFHVASSYASMYGKRGRSPQQIAEMLVADGKPEAAKVLLSGKVGKMADAPAGSLYKVDLPDGAIAKMLDWDKPMSQQTKSVRLLARPPSYTKAFKAGANFRKSGQTYDAMSADDLAAVANYTPAEQAFFDAGRLGISPPMLTVGNRYGDAPKHGKSMNYADNMPERGVSMANVEDVRFDDSWEKTISSMFIKPNREKKTYQGYVLPPQMAGSDGEPLMVAVRNPETGKEYWERLVNTLGGKEAAAKSLAERGIPGIRYLDGGSRGAGQGSSNFVVFPGNEKLLRILERNGQAVP